MVDLEAQAITDPAGSVHHFEFDPFDRYLLLNGLESLGPAGRLTVRTAYEAAAHTVTLTIEDTGCGMNEDTVARLFDLFFTTKTEGTGLGMAIARSVVDRHGGELAVESALGRGTRITIRLPLDTPERT